MNKKINFIIMLIFIFACISGMIVSGFAVPDCNTGTTDETTYCEFEYKTKTSNSHLTFIEDTEPPNILTDTEIKLIALVTMAEAEGECELGKRLVIDTILNRVKSDRWPDTVHEVIYQPNQFTSMWNGRSDRCEVTDYICNLVRGELKSQVSYTVVYFTAGTYGRYGTPLFQVGNHYFASV